MRIAYITADKGIAVFGTKGASIHIREMVNAFAGLGHDVTLLTARCGRASHVIDAEIVEVRPPFAAGVDGLLSSEEEDRAHAKELYALEVGAAIQECLVRLHAADPFDLIYERYSLFSAAGVGASHELAIPCFVEVNAPLLLEQQKFRTLAHVCEAETIEADVFRGATALLPVSEEVGNYVLSKGGRPTQTKVIPNAVDVTRFHPNVEAAGIEGASDRFVVGFAGTLKPWHGIETLMEAFRSLAVNSPDYHLLIVGDGPLRGWIDGYASGAGLDGRVTVTGWVPHDALPGLIKTMDVAVAPYPQIDDFYFSPLKLYEYMAIGTPVVASRIGQVANVIRDGVTGLLSRPGDPQGLVACVDRLRCDLDLRSSLGRTAAHDVGDQTWLRNAEQVIDLAGPLVQAA